MAVKKLKKLIIDKAYTEKELADELERFKFYHKYVAIQTALIKFEDEGIYNTKYLLPFKNIKGDGAVSRAMAICTELTDMHDRGDDRLLNELYEYCWNRLSPTLGEWDNFTEGFKATD